MYEHLLLETGDRIATISINNPKSLNALNSATLTELNSCLAELEKNKDVRVIIVTGAGPKAFVAGADIAEMSKMTPAEARAYSLLGRDTFLRLEHMPQATIAAVNGFALGGGCELAMSCDIRIAADSASFAQPECGLGLIPGFGGTQRLARLIGKGRAKELIFTCDRVDAQEAYRVGLVNHVVPKEELMSACKAMAEKLLSKSSYAISLAKTCIDNGMDVDLESGIDIEAGYFGLCFASDDTKEGTKAFLERRTAQFKDF